MSAVTIRHGFEAEHREAAAALYWQAFKGKLDKVMGPDARALAFFDATMDANYALSAVGPDGRLLGIAGFKTSAGSLSGGSLRDMTHVYGRFGGTWRGLILSALERDLMPGVLLMDGICVGADARGLGVGTALLDGIKDHARQAGLTSVRLDVIDTNPRARALYERRGFKPMGTTHTGVLRHLFGFRSATTMQCGLT